MLFNSKTVAGTGASLSSFLSATLGAQKVNPPVAGAREALLSALGAPKQVNPPPGQTKPVEAGADLSSALGAPNDNLGGEPAAAAGAALRPYPPPPPPL